MPECTGWPPWPRPLRPFARWCLALAPGSWYPRHGYFRAVKVFTARMVRERTTYALLALAVLGSVVIAKIWSIGGPHWAGLASGLAGMVIGGGLVWLVRILASAVLHREAMGFGDVTLLAMIGAFLGWQAAVVVFFLAPLAAVVVAWADCCSAAKRRFLMAPFSAWRPPSRCSPGRRLGLRRPLLLARLEVDCGLDRLSRPDRRAPAAGPLGPVAIPPKVAGTRRVPSALRSQPQVACQR